MNNVRLDPPPGCRLARGMRRTLFTLKYTAVQIKPVSAVVWGHHSHPFLCHPQTRHKTAKGLHLSLLRQNINSKALRIIQLSTRAGSGVGCCTW